MPKAIHCQQCEALNQTSANYCDACGAWLSSAGRMTRRLRQPSTVTQRLMMQCGVALLVCFLAVILLTRPGRYTGVAERIDGAWSVGTMVLRFDFGAGQLHGFPAHATQPSRLELIEERADEAVVRVNGLRTVLTLRPDGTLLMWPDGTIPEQLTRVN